MTNEIMKEMDEKFEELFGEFDITLKTINEKSDNGNDQNKGKGLNPFESIFDPMDYITGKKKMTWY